ncbi:METTL5 family protein [[Eubacterium] cellulosolvens]
MIRRKKLEIVLEKISSHPKPKFWLEQYTIPSWTAAEMLSIASDIHNSIKDKNIVDLGCGTGRLAIGSCILGAEKVLAVDIDPLAIKTADKNARLLKVKNKISWLNSDISVIKGTFDTAIMNPPFGTKIRHADSKFLLKALSIANVTISLHKRTTRNYLIKFIESKSGKINGLYEMQFKIPKTYEFHNRRSYTIDVDLYIIARAR